MRGWISPSEWGNYPITAFSLFIYTVCLPIWYWPELRVGITVKTRNTTKIIDMETFISLSLIHKNKMRLCGLWNFDQLHQMDIIRCLLSWKLRSGVSRKWFCFVLFFVHNGQLYSVKWPDVVKFHSMSGVISRIVSRKTQERQSSKNTGKQAGKWNEWKDWKRRAHLSCR